MSGDSSDGVVALAPRVAAEYIGRARLFRDAVVVADKRMAVALTEITAPLRARLRRWPFLRPEHVVKTEREWLRLVPSEFRVGAVRIDRSGREFEISETRATASLLFDNQWQDKDSERGVMLSTATLAVRDGRIQQCWCPLAIVSLQALARRIECRATANNEAIFRDLARLVDADPDVDHVDTNNGCWIGSIMTATDAGAGRIVELRSVHGWAPAPLQ